MGVETVVEEETVAKEEATVTEETTSNETSNKVVVEKEGDGDVKFNFGSNGKINFG